MVGEPVAYTTGSSGLKVTGAVLLRFVNSPITWVQVALSGGGRTASRAVFGVVVVLKRMATVVAFCAALSSWCVPGPARGQEVHTGPARIIDGNTIEVSGITHRLRGITAPGPQQMCRTDNSEKGETWPCGRCAREALHAHIQNRPVTCFTEPKDRGPPHRSTCYVHDQDIAAWLVRRGWALADRSALDSYVLEEKMVSGFGRGEWRFVERLYSGE